jgi:hypothetical protein
MLAKRKMLVRFVFSFCCQTRSESRSTRSSSGDSSATTLSSLLKAWTADAIALDLCFVGYGGGSASPVLPSICTISDCPLRRRP